MGFLNWISRQDIGVGSNGALWVIGTDTADGGYLIYNWNPGTKLFNPAISGGGGVRVSVDPSGNLWVFNNINNVWHYSGGSWT
jgi:hypothetical protein